jgi:hypothetical protein
MAAFVDWIKAHKWESALAVAGIGVAIYYGKKNAASNSITAGPGASPASNASLRPATTGYASGASLGPYSGTPQVDQGKLAVYGDQLRYSLGLAQIASGLQQSQDKNQTALAIAKLNADSEKQKLLANLASQGLKSGLAGGGSSGTGVNPFTGKPKNDTTNPLAGLLSGYPSGEPSIDPRVLGGIPPYDDSGNPYSRFANALEVGGQGAIQDPSTFSSGYPDWLGDPQNFDTGNLLTSGLFADPSNPDNYINDGGTSVDTSYNYFEGGNGLGVGYNAAILDDPSMFETSGNVFD